jgi:hypothetical protein
MSDFMKDYVPVNVRVIEFYKRHPQGVITTEAPRVIEIDGKRFIESRASVLKDPQGEPYAATAWEPFPGKTPYTKDSEAMNAETSAVGRALALAGIEVSKSLASANEVENRREFSDTVSKAVIKNRLLKAAHNDKELAAQMFKQAGEPETLTTSELVTLISETEDARRAKAGVDAPGALGWPAGKTKEAEQ